VRVWQSRTKSDEVAPDVIEFSACKEITAHVMAKP
jgi:hypothetical protein